MTAGLLRGVDRAAFCAGFAQRLRSAGMPVGLSEIEAFTRAIGVAPVDTRDRLYRVARSTLLRRHGELPVFDAVFAAVFDSPDFGLDPTARRGSPHADGEQGDRWTRTTGSPTGTQDGTGLPWATRPSVLAGGPDDPVTGPTIEHRLRASAAHELADVPFGELSEAQLMLVGTYLEVALARWPTRRSRRRRPHRGGGEVTLRATVARSRRTGWEPLEVVRTRSGRRPRRVLMLCDVSGSMQPTATAYLHLMRAAVVRSPTEVFAFGTRLTRLTPVLAHRSAERAVQLATERVTDRFGGTRIATTLAALLTERYGHAVRAATVVIISDGWDTDPPEQLERVMARLRRRAHAVLWVNPRVSAPGFAPLVGGMAAALPYCDRLLAGHSLRALTEVVDAVVEAG